MVLSKVRITRVRMNNDTVRRGSYAFGNKAGSNVPAGLSSDGDRALRMRTLEARLKHLRDCCRFIWFVVGVSATRLACVTNGLLVVACKAWHVPPLAADRSTALCRAAGILVGRAGVVRVGVSTRWGNFTEVVSVLAKVTNEC